MANPLNEKRMELILQQKLNDDKAFEEKEEDVEEVDEVSVLYYRAEHCTCSRNAMCQSNKCICAISDKKCTDKCHDGKKTKCKNK